MHAVTVFVDGLESPQPFVSELQSALLIRGLAAVCPTVPRSVDVHAMLRAARATVATDDLDAETGPSDTVLSELARVELLEVAKLTLAAVQRSWCGAATSSVHRIRVNLCTESELYAGLTIERNPNLSTECKGIARELLRKPYGAAPLLHLYGGPADGGAEYLLAAETAGVTAYQVDSVEAAVAAVTRFIEPLLPRPIDPAEFL